MRSERNPEELISCWTLDEADWRLLANKTGATRLGFAVLLKFLELEGRFPADAAEVPTAALDYLAGQVKADSAELEGYWSGRAVNFPDLCRLLPQDVAEPLLERYHDPQQTPAALMRALLERFAVGRWVLLLDNLEDVVDTDGVGLTDSALEEALVTALRAPQHGVKVIITTRVAPRDVLLAQPGVQRRLNLDEGLPSPFAEEVLRAMDADGRTSSPRPVELGATT